MDAPTLYFSTVALGASDIVGKRILEVGSRNINGSCRAFVEGHFPAVYVGTDIVPGPGVDHLISAHSLVFLFGDESFDGVICTNTLEHIQEWKEAVANIKRVLRPHGWILFSMPAPGFPYHEYPGDFWRATMDDLRRMFSDFYVELEGGNGPVSCVKVRKPALWEPSAHTFHDLPAVGLKEKTAYWAEKAKGTFLRAGSAVYRTIKRK